MSFGVVIVWTLKVATWKYEIDTSFFIYVKSWWSNWCLYTRSFDLSILYLGTRACMAGGVVNWWVEWIHSVRGPRCDLGKIILLIYSFVKEGDWTKFFQVLFSSNYVIVNFLLDQIPQSRKSCLFFPPAGNCRCFLLNMVWHPGLVLFLSTECIVLG